MVALTLSLYNWTHYTTTKDTIKMHTLLDYETLLSEFMTIGTGKCTDEKAFFEIPIAPYSVVVANRGYCNFELLNDWDSKHILFVAHHRDNLLYGAIRDSTYSNT